MRGVRAIGWLGILALLVALPAAAANLHGKVISVSDGDTITVLDATQRTHKIRLAGIDAPEKSQAHGMDAKQHLSNLVLGKVVEVDGDKQDKYGRTVGKVLYQGKDANLTQSQTGWAWHYVAYASEQSPADRDAYAVAESKHAPNG